MRETQIPFVVREILGIEDINDVTTLDLSGRGIGDEKMCCVIRSLPYFRSCEEILIAGKKKILLPLLYHYVMHHGIYLRHQSYDNHYILEI
jgi:hypothetical protein